MQHAKEKGNVHMSNIVRTWEDEAIPAGEIELTDAQLAAVYGAWGEECEPKPKPKCEEEESHKKFEKEVKIHVEFEFEFEAEFKKEKKKFKKDCNW